MENDASQLISEPVKTKNIFWQVFSYKDMFWLVPFLVIVVAFPVWIFYANIIDEKVIDVWAAFIFVFIVIVMIKYGRFKDKIWENFAKTHGFGKGLLREKKLERDQGSIFTQGHHSKLLDYYSNPAGYEISQIETAYGTGESRTTNYVNYTIFSAVLRKKYPFAQVLRRGLWYKPGQFYKPHLSKTESHEFNKKYLLNAHQPQDAFYVFNPTVLSVLLDTKNRYSVEVQEDMISVFTDLEITNGKVYEEMWQTLLKIKDALE